MELSFYQNPVVRDRLINYYATDEVFRRLVGYYASDPVYKDIADAIETIKEGVYAILPPELEFLVGIEPSLREFNSAMAGKIISDFFGKVSDLVGGHANLTWYATPEVVSSAFGLFSRGANIAGLTDFAMGTTPTGASRWDRFQTYLNDELYLGVQDLMDMRPRMGDMRSLVDALIAQATEEGVSFEAIRDRIRWYSRGDVIGALNDRINLRFGPFRIEAFDLIAEPSARGAGGRMLVQDLGNKLRINFGGDFAETILDGPLTDVWGNLGLHGLLGGPSFNGIRDRLQEIQDTLETSIATLGDRNTPGTTFGDLFVFRQDMASWNRSANTYQIRNLCDILLGIDEIVNTMGRVRDRIRSIITDHFTPW